MKTTKKRKPSKRKRVGGAYGLVLNVDYDKSGNIKNIRLQDMLARHDYMKRNKIDPSHSLADQLKESFNLDRLQESFHDFLYLQPPGDTRKTKKRTVKIALNDKRDIQLIQLVNKVISRLNNIKAASRAPQPLFIIRDAAGKLGSRTKQEFRKRYEEILAGPFLEDYEKEQKNLNKELLKRLMRMPVLMNLVSIKYGLLNRGDMKLEELQGIYNLDNGRILELVPEPKVRSGTVAYDQIIKEENEKLAEENKKLQVKLDALKANKVPEPDLVVLEELGEKNAVEELLQEGEGEPTANAESTESGLAPVVPLIPPASTVSGSAPTVPLTPAPSNASTASSSIASGIIPPASVSTPPASVSTPAPPAAAQKLDPNNPRVRSITQFNDLLKRKFGGKVAEIDNNTSDFLAELKTTQLDPVKLMQYYLIKNILVCIGVEETELYKPKSNIAKDSIKRQATILTLIRILLTEDMRNFEQYKNNFDTKNLCSSLKQAASALSGIVGTFLRNDYNLKWSYDDITNSIETLCAKNDYAGIITLHLNKLHDFFVKKDPAYIESMKSKSLSNGTDKTRGGYDEKYDTSNPNYIFS